MPICVVWCCCLSHLTHRCFLPRASLLSLLTSDNLTRFVTIPRKLIIQAFEFDFANKNIVLFALFAAKTDVRVPMAIRGEFSGNVCFS